MTPLELWACEYRQRVREIRALTRRLREFDGEPLSDAYAPLLRCQTPHVDKSSGAATACRKMEIEQSYPEGATVLVPFRERDEWCASCVEVQRIVDARKEAVRRRGIAMRAIGALGESLLRERGRVLKEEIKADAQV